MPFVQGYEYEDNTTFDARINVYTRDVIQLPGITCFGWQQAKRPYYEEIPTHFHRDCFEFHYMMQGNLSFEVDNQSYVLRSGEAFVTFPNELHRSGEQTIVRQMVWWRVADSGPLLGLDDEAAACLRQGLHGLQNRVIRVGDEMRAMLREVYDNILLDETGPRMYAAAQMTAVLYKLTTSDNLVKHLDYHFYTSEMIPVTPGDVITFGPAAIHQGWHIVTLGRNGRITDTVRLSNGLQIVETLDNTTAIMRYVVNKGVTGVRMIATTDRLLQYVVTREQPFTGKELADYWQAPDASPLRNLFNHHRGQKGWVDYRHRGSRILSPEIQRAAIYIRQHTDRALQLDEVAAYVHLSLSHFKARFKQETGSTPALYIQQQRIEKAKGLLKRGFSVSETARKLDFCSANYFSVVFRRVTNMTPSQFQKNCRESSVDKTARA